MQLRHLRYFVVAAHHEHFGRAAKALSIVQPALSKQIAQLEEKVGTPLFERLSRSVRLTAAGHSFWQDANTILQQVDRAAERARDVGKGRVGLLRIGFVETVGYGKLFPKIVQRFRQKHFAVKLDLAQQTSATQGELLREGKIDVGFLFHQAVNAPAFEGIEIAREEILLAMPSGHPLARKRRLDLKDFKDESFVWINRAVSPPFYDLVFAACARRGFVPRIVQEGTTDAANLSLVAAQVGVSLCIASALTWKPPEVVLRRVAGLEEKVHLSIVWSETNRNPALPYFLSTVRGVATPTS